MSQLNEHATNVDPAELKKFSALAHRWWDRNSEFKPLHDINPLRLHWIEQHAQGLKGKRILDVACGGGILAEAMAQQQAEVVGIDLAEKPLEVARLHALESGVVVDYRVISAEQLALLEPESFDVVTCMEMLEHVPDPAAIVQACANLVRPGGKVFFSTLNRNLKSYLLAVIGAEYILKMLPKGTHDYAKFLKPCELTQFARAAGLSVTALSGMTYNPLSRRFSLSPNVDVNYLVACSK